MNHASPIIIQAAKDFWKRAGVSYTVPCNIIEAVEYALPPAVVSLEELSLKKIQDWLAERKVALHLDIDNRPLSGFIYFSNGGGNIFINESDSEEEKRYTAAHEASHYLLDYELLRNNAVKKFGKSILEVMDRLREPTDEERIDGILASVAISPYMHLLEKDGDGSFINEKALRAENQSDELALELLAPAADVIKDTNPDKSKISFYDFRDLCCQILKNKYLIPGSIAETYSYKLANAVTGGPSLIHKLGL